MGLCAGIGMLIAARGRAGWVEAACVLGGGALVILSIGRLLPGLWEIATRSEPVGRARAETLLRRMPREEAPLEEEPYDPGTGRGVGVFVPDPSQRDLDRIAGAECIRHLLSVFAGESGRRQRLADRLLLYVGVDARTGEHVGHDRALRLQQRRQQLRAAEDPEGGSFLEQRHLVGGGTLLVGMAACCLLAWGGADTWVILGVALLAGGLVSVFT